MICDNLCKVLVPTEVEKLLLFAKNFFLCSTSLQKTVDVKYRTCIYADAHYRDQCDKVINNRKPSYFYFLKKCHFYPLEHISVFIVFQKTQFSLLFQAL